MGSVGSKSKCPCNSPCTGDGCNGRAACCGCGGGAAADSGGALTIVAGACNESFLDALRSTSADS